MFLSCNEIKDDLVRVFTNSCFRMDISSAIRIAVRVPAYYEVCDDGRHVGHSATDFQLIRDRDTLNLKNLTADVSKRVCPRKNQGFNLCFLTSTSKVIPV